MFGEARPPKDSGLAELVREYRRAAAAAAAPGAIGERAHPELEVRLQGVDRELLAALYDHFVVRGEGTAGEPPAHSQTVTTITRADRRARGEGGGRAAPACLREIPFVAGERGRDRLLTKAPLADPWRAPAGGGPGGGGAPFLVALAAETPARAAPVADERSVIRVKVRASVGLAVAAEGGPPLRWRLDLTVVRQLSGKDVGALQGVVDAMFRGAGGAAGAPGAPGTPGTVPALLAAPPGTAALLQYEAEVEFAEGPATRGAVRPADVLAAAEAVLRVAAPGRRGEARLLEAVRRVADLMGAAPPADGSLKRLLPQATPLSRADYRLLYPPAGFFVTAKADGRRAVALAVGGSGAILSTELLLFGPGGAGAAGAAAGAGAGAGAAGAAQLVTALDGELVEGPGGAPTFFAFDAIAVAGDRLVGLPFEGRLARLAEGVRALVAAGVPARTKPFARVGAPLPGAAPFVPTAPGGAAPPAPSGGGAPSGGSGDAPRPGPEPPALGGGGDAPRPGLEPAALEAVFRRIHDAPHPFGIDGLILVEPGRPYAATRNLKWKGAADNTIDFLARRAPPSVLGRPPFEDRPDAELFLLFVGVRADVYSALGLMRCPGYRDLFPGADWHRGGGAAGGAAAAAAAAYFPVQFAPADVPLAYLYWHPRGGPPIDGRVVELRCGGGCAAAGGGTRFVEWELVRVRDDRAKDLLSARYFGNDLRTAEATWLNNVDPFPLEMLWEGPGGDYFDAPKEGSFAAQTAVVSFLKSRGIAPLQHADWVVDLGAGKGQDLGRYLKAGVRHLVAVDSSRAALTELVRRRLEVAFRRGGPRGGPPGPAPPEGRTALHVLAADAARPAAETAAALGRLGVPPGGADALVCNLAVHYFLGTVEGLRNFAALAGALVRPGGRVVLTFLDGARVHARLQGLPEGGSWDLLEGGARKFSLRRLYASPRLETAGQRIAVLLPFSSGAYYEEFLVNIAALTAEMKARGFAPEAPPVYAADLVGAFRAQRPELAGRLSPQDLEYLGLIVGLTFLRAEAPAPRRGRG
jgi:hypothetical protein